MKTLKFLLSILFISGLVLAACGGAATTEAPAPEPTEAPAAEPTEAPPEEPQDLLAAIQERGVILVSTDANYAPQSFVESDGTFSGFDIDTATEIAKRLGVEVEFVTPDWDVITAGNWGDQWDISVGSMTITTARSEVLHFMTPYYYTPAQFAAADGSGINTLDDVNGQAVCMGTATTYEDWLNGVELGLPPESFYADPPTDVTLVPLPTDAECIQAIQAGREEFQVVLTSNTVVEAALAAGVPIHKVGTPVFSENLSVSIDKNHSLDPTSLVAAIDQIVQDMHADGTLSAFSMEWFGEDLSIDPTTMEAPEVVELGTEDNPLVWVLVPSQDTEAVLAGAEDIAQAVEDQTGLIVTPLVTTDYTGAVEAMCSGEAHLGALNTFNYVLANARGCAEVAVASVRFGSTFYSGQVVTQAGSGIESIADLAGTTFCRPDPTSTSGWVIPSIAMQAEGLDPEADLGEIVDTGGHDAVIIAVYNGDCDAGASFVDARSIVEDEFPDVKDVVVVIAESAPIPNDNISYTPSVPAEARDALTGVFLDLASTEEGLEILNTVYSWSGMEEVDDSFYDGFRQQLEAAGIDIEDLAGG